MTFKNQRSSSNGMLNTETFCIWYQAVYETTSISEMVGTKRDILNSLTKYWKTRSVAIK